MNKIFTFILAVFFLFNGLLAAPITSDKAKLIATTFLIERSSVATSGNMSLKMLKSPDLQQISDELTLANQQFYVFNHDNDRGFIVISADDCAYPVLCYSDNGSFDPNNIPPNMQKWLESYKTEIRYAVENNIEATPEIKYAWQTLEKGNFLKQQKSTNSVSPLISTKWDQGTYYNTLCPYDNTYSERTVTGCVATAMAQVMKYWNYPVTGTGFHSYNHSKYGTLSANFGSTTYQWNFMPNTVYSSNSAVATLMYHCGVSVDMDYGPGATGGSGAITICSGYSNCTVSAEDALKTYFGYKTTLKGIHKSHYTNANWINLLKGELDAGRPMIYAGTGDAGGHAFVCDGYDSNNYFHFNWGWSGQNDGYFSLSALNPGSGGAGGGSYQFTDSQRAIIGIEPANGGMPQSYDLRLYSNLSMSATQIWFGSDFSVNVSIGNYGTSTFSGQLGAAVFDEDGNFVDFMAAETVSLPGNKYDTYTFNNTAATVFVPGTYYVAIFYKTTTQDWTIVADGNYDNLKEFLIYYYSDIEVGSEFTINTNGGKLVNGSSATVNVDIVNTGSSTFYGKFRISLANLDGSWAQDIQSMEENNGLPSNYHYNGGKNFTGTITVAPGTYLMEVAYQAKGSSDWYYAGSYYYPNPVYVIVEASDLKPDIYENNNTQSQACNLPVNFSGNSATINTNGSNFHVGNDVDYYKVVLPSGYNYTITPRLDDEYSSGNGQTYTVDALFSYSINGTTYSETYDDVMAGNINVSNGGTVYFKVVPYFSGNTGTYLLTMNIIRGGTTGIEYSGADAPITLSPNPAKDFVTIDLQNITEDISRIAICDVQGREIYNRTIDNFTNKIDMPLANVSNGIYFVQIYSVTGILVKKLIVEK